MAVAAVAAPAPPISLETRMRFSQLNVRFRLPGIDEIFSVRGDAVYYKEGVIKYVNKLLVSQQQRGHVRIPAPGAWKMQSGGETLKLQGWDLEAAGGNIIDICGLLPTAMKPSSGTIRMHSSASSLTDPVNIKMFGDTVIELPGRELILLDVHLNRRSGKKKKVELIRAIELMVGSSTTVFRLLAVLKIAPTKVHCFELVDAKGVSAGGKRVPISADQFGDTIASFVGSATRRLEVILII